MKHIFYFFVIISIPLFSCGGKADNLNENDLAPDFTLQDASAKTYKLSELRGSPVVLYFYPKANTPGCTKQACGIRDNWERFNAAGIKVFGISVDSKEALSKFIDEYGLNFPLLSDENKEVSRAYGVLNNIGLSSRITFVIDKNGYIANIIRDVEIDKHADDIYTFASKLL